MSDAIKEMLASPGWLEIHRRLIADIVDYYLRYRNVETERGKASIDARIDTLRELLNLPVTLGLKEPGIVEREIAEGIEKGL